ncbi:MAG: NPCBM/NEW2 domain-containing protein, partial [Planctomycetota bacterium]
PCSRAASQPAAAALEQGRAAAADPAADCFMRLRNGDHLAARGVTIRDGCAEIDWQGGRNAIPLDRIQSLTWAAVVAQDAPSLPTLRLALDDGSRFSLTSLGPSEPALTVDPALVVAVAGEGAAATSLAMLAPIAFEHSSTAGPTRPLARGQTLTGDWPAARGITGFTGLGIHAPARVRYRLDRPADRFESTVAIDDSAGRDGSVVVRIVAIDDRAERREVYVSPVLRGDEEPLVIRAELAGARELELVVEPAGRGGRLDRTIWLDPRVITIE